MFYTMVAALIAVYFLVRYYFYSYWDRLGFPFLAPTMFIGNLWSVVSSETSFGLSIYELYKKSTDRYVGIYLFYRPALLIRDAAFVKRVLSTDFNNFHDRGVYSRPHEDPISDHIFAMEGQRWRDLRAKFTPIFTSGRLKNMLPTIGEKGDRLQKLIQPLAAGDTAIELKDLTNRYALDVIASVFFGLDVDTLGDPDHSFRTIERGLGNGPGFLANYVPVLIFLCPKFLTLLRLPSLPPKVKKFIMTLITDQIEYREKERVLRKDFIQFLIQIRNTGKVSLDDSNWDIEPVANEKKTMSIEQCAGQIFIFYVAGYDTSSSTITYTIFEVARNPEIKKKLRDDIDSAMKKHGGKLTYECLQDMAYLDLCVMETVRKYPVLPMLNRICTKDYNVPDTNLTIKEGTAIVISMMGISRDPAYFPDPMLYRPERFSDEIPQYNKDAYIPFGDGPRTCIGLRLGKMIAKCGIIKLMSRFDFETTNPNQPELEFESYGVTLVVKGGVNLKVRERTDR